MFKPRFAPLVKSGQKRQTVRPWPKRVPQRGDIIDCREWAGKPYRSKQRRLREADIFNVRVIRIRNLKSYVLDGIKVDLPRDLNAFAKADGFADWLEMVNWFKREHGLPFRGILILWT